MKMTHTVSFILLVIGGLNWLLVGLFQMDISNYLGGMASSTSRVIYVLVGLAAIYELVIHKKVCKMCNPNPGM